MPIQFDKFDQQKIDRLKSHLESMATKGQAKFYEIYVDALKAVPKTDNPSEFEGYEDYMTADTNQIKVVVYSSGQSPRNDQYVFAMKAKNGEEAFDMGLNGIAFRGFTTSELKSIKEQRDRKALDNLQIQELKSEIGELNAELDEKETYITQLENGIEAAKANGNKIGNVHIGEIVSVALEGLVKRNTHILAQVPGLDGLAGLIEKENQPAVQQPATEVTFKKKDQSDSTPQLTEHQKEWLALFGEIQRHFSQSEIEQVIELLEALSKDKSKINPVLELVTDKEAAK